MGVFTRLDLCVSFGVIVVPGMSTVTTSLSERYVEQELTYHAIRSRRQTCQGLPVK